MTNTRGDAETPLVDFAGLYREHAPHVHRFALYLSGNASLADDLVSEAFVRVWTARERVELTTVRGYLFTIVRNLFLQHVRHERRRAPLDERMSDDRTGSGVARERSRQAAEPPHWGYQWRPRR